MKKTKKFLKKLVDLYFKGFGEMYRPALEQGINPFM